ncbi:unnamed protein product, partial [Ectocarpus sp. 13 AM-2016]
YPFEVNHSRRGCVGVFAVSGGKPGEYGSYVTCRAQAEVLERRCLRAWNLPPTLPFRHHTFQKAASEPNAVHILHKPQGQSCQSSDKTETPPTAARIFHTRMVLYLDR